MPKNSRPPAPSSCGQPTLSRDLTILDFLTEDELQDMQERAFCLGVLHTLIWIIAFTEAHRHR